jgi:hypothetical protein
MVENDGPRVVVLMGIGAESGSDDNLFITVQVLKLKAKTNRI